MNIKKTFKSKLLEDSLIYGISNAFFSGLPLLILPLIVKKLLPEDYGLVELYRNVSMLLVPILGLSTAQSVVRFFYDLKLTEFKSFVSNLIYFHFCSAFLGLFLIQLIASFLNSDYLWILNFSIMYFLFNQLTEMLLSIYRVNKKAVNYVGIRMLQVSLDLCILFFLFLFFEEWDWKSRVVPNILAAFLTGGISVFILYKQDYFKTFSSKLFKLAVSYSAPLILHMISAFALNMGDRFFILYYLGEEELGNYSVMYQLGMAVNFLYTSFNLSWVPSFFELMAKGDTKKIQKIRNIVFVAIILFSVFVYGAVLIAVKYTTIFANYSVDMVLVFIILGSYVLFSMYKFQSNYFFFNKNTKALSLITFSSTIIALFMNFVLVPKIGVYGSAMATLVSCILLFSLTSIFRSKE